MSKTKREQPEMQCLTAEETDAVCGGLTPPSPVVCRYPADPEQTCGTKGPGPHVPVLW